METYSYPASLYPPATIASAIDMTSFSEMQFSLREIDIEVQYWNLTQGAMHDNKFN